ncbi:MAG: GXWXG domain-containing protein, partial [Flavobacteriaceae bacterium]|nr:GXWXG domain-containing protein [Flavobacteriaceae bacterium]
MKPQNLLKQRRSTVSTATSVFDSLDSVSLDFMLGQWKGFEIITGHPMEGLLEPSGWYGKLFIDTENVHPLLMNTLNKKGLYAIN